MDRTCLASQYLTAKSWNDGKRRGLTTLSCWNSSQGLDRAGVPDNRITRLANCTTREGLASITILILFHWLFPHKIQYKILFENCCDLLSFKCFQKLPIVRNLYTVKSFWTFHCAFYKDILHFQNQNTALKNKINNWTKCRIFTWYPRVWFMSSFPNFRKFPKKLHLWVHYLEEGDSCLRPCRLVILQEVGFILKEEIREFILWITKKNCTSTCRYNSWKFVISKLEIKV